MANQTNVERLCSADTDTLRAIAALEVSAWGRTPDTEALEVKARRLRVELQRLHPDRKAVFIARKCGRIVGVSRIQRWPDGADDWMLYGLAVHPDNRRQGIGRALADASVGFARAGGAWRMRCETHLDNQVSIAFHKAIGFRDGGRFVASDGDEKISFSL